MIKQILKLSIFSTGLIIILNSCGLQKEVVYRLDNQPKDYVDLPLDYCNLFPDSSSFEQWDKDYNLFEKFLTKDILKTQMGLSYTINGVQIWWCIPSARTHVQLDTTTMILNNDLVVGEWRAVTNRRITYEDSASYSVKKMYRSTKLDYDNKEDYFYLLITPEKFKLYAKTKGKDNYKNVANKNYDIESKRYIMLFGASRTGSAISFIGLDKENRLILNSYYVQERKIKGIYIVYQATMTQMIFERINNN